MEVVSVCPLPVASLLWQRPSTWVLTVVCRGTFLLRPGEVTLAPEQEAPNENDAYWNDDPARSVRAASDLCPLKPRADVLLVGRAFAPGGRPVRSLIARLVVGEIDKSIEVCADRTFDTSSVLREGHMFARMPLAYDRAAGGPSTWNPVGVAYQSRNRLGNMILPNLQPPGLVVTSPNDFIPPVGFGPIAATWPSRVEKLGAYGAQSSERAWRGPMLPTDLDPAYFNAAPHDQQLLQLREGEIVTLENLHPEHPRLVTSLPRLQPQATLEGRGGAHPIALQCDTLWIDTDRSLCTLTWRGQVPLSNPQEAGRVVITLTQPLRTGRQPTWTGVGGPPPPRSSPTGEHRAPTESEAAASAVLEGTMNLAAHLAHSKPPFPAHGAPAPRDTARIVPPEQSSKPSQARGQDPLAQSASSWGAVPIPAPPPARASQASSPGFAPTNEQRAPAADATPTTETLEGTMNVAALLAGPTLPFAGQGAPPPRDAARTAAAEPFLPFGPSKPRDQLAQSSSSWGTPPAAVPGFVASEIQPPVEQPSRVAPFGLPPPAAPPAYRTPEPRSIGHAPEAALGGIAMASNAAAAQAAPRLVPVSDAPRLEPVPAPALEPGTVLQLLWYDADAVPRIRRKAGWRRILEALESRPLDPEVDDPAFAAEPIDIEDRREVFEILARGEAMSPEGTSRALSAGVREGAKFVALLELFTGELVFAFDELEKLKATTTTVAPLVVSGDDALKAAVTAAQDFLAMPGLSSTPAVAEGLTKRLKDAFGQTARAMPAGYVESQAERALLEQRHYQRRQVLGAPHIRAVLGTGSHAVPVYLPDALAKRLPMFQRFKVRVIAEVHPRVDQYESHPAALKVLVVGWVMAAPGGR